MLICYLFECMLKLNQNIFKIEKYQNIKLLHIHRNIDGLFFAHRAKLQELSSKLQEETRKRLEAEEQKTNLELRLEKLSHERKGQILMDANVVKEMTEACEVFNYFLAIFSKRGYGFRFKYHNILVISTPEQQHTIFLIIIIIIK